MASAALTLEELGEAPVPLPARPRVLLVATVLASVAAVAGFAALLGIYLHERSAALASDGEWLAGGTIPLTPGNLSLVGFGISLFTMAWAVQAIANEDRRHTWLAFGATTLVAAMHAVGTSFLYFEMGLEVATLQGALIYAVTGAHLAMVGGAVLFALLMAFRTLGGQYSARDHEGVTAAAVFWYATALLYVPIWYAIYVTK